jgi:hypothetical protein
LFLFAEAVSQTHNVATDAASIVVSAESCAWIVEKFERTGERFVEILDWAIGESSELIFET